MSRLSTSLLSLLAIGAFSLPVVAAELAPLATVYIQVGTAQAKADSALVSLIDNLKPSLDAMNQKMESNHRKMAQGTETLRETEEKKIERKDQILIDSYKATEAKIEADWRTAQESRGTLSNRWRQTGDVANALRQAFSQLSSVDRALRDARLDPTPMIQLYASVEAKASEADTQAKAALTEFTALSKTWENGAAETGTATRTAAP